MTKLNKLTTVWRTKKSFREDQKLKLSHLKIIKLKEKTEDTMEFLKPGGGPPMQYLNEGL